MYQRFHRVSKSLAEALALVGGLVLMGLIVLTCVSIVGRAFVPLDIGLGPIRGIYDVTEIGMAIAVFSFLPLAQFYDAHARVDLFQPVMNKALMAGLDVVFNAAMLVLAYVGTERLWLGMLDKRAYHETTLIAQIPVWWGYAASLFGAVGFVFVAAFCTLRAMRRVAGLPD